jgi:hypothetical protein
MNHHSSRRMWHLILIALVTLIMTGCTPKLDGKYENANGIMSVEFQSGKAYVGTILGQVEAQYEVNGDKVTLKYQGENVVLTRNSDGSLEGPMGKMTKK